MSSLIKNELVKIFKKKSFYIVMLITLIFIVVFNIISKNMNSESIYNNNIDEQIKYYEEQLAKLNPANESDREVYIQYKTSLETERLAQKYGGSRAWQYTIINNNMRDMIEELTRYELAVEKDENMYKKTLEKYNTIISRFDKNDWKYFAQEELKDVNSQLDKQNKIKDTIVDKVQRNSIDNNIYDLELQKQILNWRLEKDISYAPSYQNSILNQYYSNSLEVRNYETSQYVGSEGEQEYKFSLRLANEAKYDIEHGTQISNNTDARGILLNIFSQYELFIVIIIVMIAGTIVSEEFNKGTVKLLLVRPYKRSTILTSKFITCIVMLVISILLIISMQFIVGGIIQGFDSLQTPAVEYNYSTKQMEETSILSYVGMQTLGKLPIYLLLMTLAFALSTIFNNSAVAITLTLLGYMGSSMINAMGTQFNLEWIKFFVTPNWDLTQYYFGATPMFKGQTPIFSIIINLIYFIIMMVTTYLTFKKRNIKNI